MTMEAAGSTKTLVPVASYPMLHFQYGHLFVENGKKRKTILSIFIWSFIFSEGLVYLITDEGWTIEEHESSVGVLYKSTEIWLEVNLGVVVCIYMTSLRTHGTVLNLHALVCCMTFKQYNIICVYILSVPVLRYDLSDLTEYFHSFLKFFHMEA